MSMNKLIADINMDPEVTDHCEDEMTGVNMKNGTVNTSLEENDTETNNGEENLVTNKNAPGINWDLLEVEPIESKDHGETVHLGSILPEKNVKGYENVKGAYGNVDSVLKESVGSEVLLKDGEAKDKGDEVDHKMLNLEGGNANTSGVGGDSDMNGLELTLDTSVRDTPVGAGHRAEIKTDQTDLGPTLRSLVDSNPPKKRGRPRKEKKNMTDTSVQDTPVSAGQGAEMNRDQTDLGSTVRSLVDSNPPKRRGRPRKENKNMNDANTDSSLVVYNTGESSSSRGKRERRESEYLKKLYIINQDSLKRPRKEGKKVKNAGDDKAERSSEEVLLDLIAAAQGTLNPDNSILTKATRVLVISFRDSLSSKDGVKNSREVAVALSPVLLDARGKLEDMITSLSESDLESKESLIGDAQGLLEKVNLALTNNVL